MACLVFGAWLHSKGGSEALREGGRYIAKIPFPRITVPVKLTRGKITKK